MQVQFSCTEVKLQTSVVYAGTQVGTHTLGTDSTWCQLKSSTITIGTTHYCYKSNWYQFYLS